MKLLSDPESKRARAGILFPSSSLIMTIAVASRTLEEHLWAVPATMLLVATEFAACGVMEVDVEGVGGGAVLCPCLTALLPSVGARGLGFLSALNKPAYDVDPYNVDRNI